MSAKVLFLKSDGKESCVSSPFFNDLSEEELKRPVSLDQRKNVAEKVKSLSKDAHLEIFFLLKDSGTRYTSNHNGIFFNINSISDKMFNRLERLVDFCYENEKKLVESYNERFGTHIEREESDDFNQSVDSEEKVSANK